MLKAKIDISDKDKFERSPLFFMKVETKEVQTGSSYYDRETVKYWSSAIDYISCTISNEEMEVVGNSKLMIADYPFNPVENKPDDENHAPDSLKLEYGIHEFSTNSYYDMWFLFNRMLTRKQANRRDIFYFQELLWALNSNSFNPTVTQQALAQYNDYYQVEILKVIDDVSHCLSFKRQEVISKFLAQHNIKGKIYFPEVLREALSFTEESILSISDEWDIFSIIAVLLGYESVNDKDTNYCIYVNYEENVLHKTNNDLIKTYLWLQDDKYKLPDYDFIIRFYSLFTPQIQLDIVRRYFHDIRLGYTQYSEEILSNFLDNKFKRFERFCHVLKSNLTPLDMTVALLCDNIRHFIKSGGRTFQNFNGVLDRTFLNANPVYSAMDFNLNKILPECNGGAVYNNDFIGFINYRLIGELNDDSFNEENIVNFLNSLGSRGFKFEYSCHIEGVKDESAMPQACHGCITAQKKRIDLDYWHIYSKPNKELIGKLFGINVNPDSSEELTINLSDIELSKFKERLILFFDEKYKKDESKWLITPGSYYIYRNLWSLFGIISITRIYVRKDIVVGCNVLNIDYEKSENISEDQALEEKRKRETEITIQLVKDALERITGKELVNGYIDLPFDPIEVDRICKIFYHKNDEQTDNKKKLQFLSGRPVGKYSIYCAPEYENNINDATNLAYFWCQRRECFRNVLTTQVLCNSKTWKDYKLFHMLEICGYPLLKVTPAGYEAAAEIRNLIAIVNKVKNFYEKLKCEGCGHLIWAKYSGTFNRYNRFECINNLCTEYGNEIYLSYCNKCKRGIIDSRVSAQCPNGWRICPTCFGCCNDDIIESIAQKYIVSHRPIPPKIERQRGNGHNNKDIFFCPKCGGQIIERHDDERNETFYLCENCGHRNIELTKLNNLIYEKKRIK